MNDSSARSQGFSFQHNANHPRRADPYGYPYGFGNIYRTLKAGSGNAAHINRFSWVPRAQFLGVTPQDIIDYGLADATHPLSKTDIKRATEIEGQVFDFEFRNLAGQSCRISRCRIGILSMSA